MSLRSIILKGRFFAEQQDPEFHERLGECAAYLTYSLHSPNVMLVNAESVWRDLGVFDDDGWTKLDNIRRTVAYPDIPKPKPPYSLMWMEGMKTHRGQAFGVLTNRVEIKGNLESVLAASNFFRPAIEQDIRDDNPQTIVNITVVVEVGGSACPSGSIVYWLDKEGKFQRSCRIYVKPGTDDEKEREARLVWIKIAEGWVLHSFARMNCANVQLVKIAGTGVHKHRPGRNDPPSSIWHEIKIESIPNIRSTARAATLPDEQKREVRFHWVRGHYADYSKGAGLFGNPKLRCVFWIPEHRAGKEDLGSIKSSYKIVGHEA